ncbi:MAG: SAM-dependent DNA methyltransferase [Caldilinea sp. CFX5]|nr:SAM-dependent DNA methyltransferase [Caldilinea sp. CFX5]
MLTGEIRSQVDRVWDAFWTGGISNSLEVIEQVTYLLFIKRLDEIHTRDEARANRFQQPMINPIFPPGLYPSAPPIPYDDLRWSRFKHREARAMYDLITGAVFPFVKSLGPEKSAFAVHMKDARFTLPPEKAGLLAKVVEMIDRIPMEDRDTKGDLYEYMLSKLAQAGQNGQFRTPRHIIKLMVEMVAPTPQDEICDPACGTAGFLVAAAEYLNEHQRRDIYGDDRLRARFNGPMFHGFDFDSTMLRVATMNMLLHGVEQPDIANRDSLSEDHGGVEEQFTLLLANPPFAGSLDYESTAKDLLTMVKTKKTELLFVALFLRLLKPGGRAAVIVPDGVLFGSSNAHKTLRRLLVEEQKLDAIVSMPSGVFKPYAGVSTAILFFTKTNSGGTDQVWFYDMQADGYSLDDKRTPLDAGKHEQNNLPDILARWRNRPAEATRPRTAQSFLAPKAEIAANDYDLSINRYKEIVYDEVQYDPPAIILAELEALEAEIQADLKTLRHLIVGEW